MKQLIDFHHPLSFSLISSYNHRCTQQISNPPIILSFRSFLLKTPDSRKALPDSFVLIFLTNGEGIFCVVLIDALRQYFINFNCTLSPTNFHSTHKQKVLPGQSRPLYQYSLDRKRPLHTFSCEQNAQILMRLDRERQKKYGSSGRLSVSLSPNVNLTR